MRTLIKIAWRNIWRNRVRSLIIMAAIVIGLMGGTFSAAVRYGAERQQFRDTIDNQISHIQIHRPEFVANPEARFRIADGFGVAEELRRLQDVRAAAPRTVFDGMAASAGTAAGVRIKGVDPEAEAATTGLDRLIVEGTYFTEEGRLPAVLLGRELADKLNSRVGSRIVLTFQDISGEIVSASFRVEGLYTVTSADFEERMVFARASDINDFIGDPEAVTEIALMLNDPEDYRSVAGRLQGAYPDLEVRHWADLAPTLHFALEFLSRSLVWLVGIVIMGVSFGLLNTILMSVLERVRELGVLMAVGMKRARVFAMVVLETTLVSLIGGAVGLVLSYGLVSWFKNRGINMSGAGGEGLRAYGYAPVIYPELEPAIYLQIAALLVVFAVLAALYPAWKAVRLVPAEAVREE